ncbi:MAG TPA: DUF1697 domain-containing protein [Thermoanaerobaculia bacterium]|nr:DUF1697 domain-containing protein [Thermoanaerobaculia bacterium]
METCVALIRGINVGGRNLISMSALREAVEGAGVIAPRTLLQSGNLVFRTASRDLAELEAVLEEVTEARFGIRPDFCIRSADAWTRIVAANPFPAVAADSPDRLLVMFMKRPVAARAVEELRAAIIGPESLKEVGGEFYITYPDGIVRSKLTGQFIEKRVGVRGTARNWNTVFRIAGLLETK